MLSLCMKFIEILFPDLILCSFVLDVCRCSNLIDITVSIDIDSISFHSSNLKITIYTNKGYNEIFCYSQTLLRGYGLLRDQPWGPSKKFHTDLFEINNSVSININPFDKNFCGDPWARLGIKLFIFFLLIFLGASRFRHLWRLPSISLQSLDPIQILTSVISGLK